jgi:hypothetical protein
VTQFVPTDSGRSPGIEKGWNSACAVGGRNRKKRGSKPDKYNDKEMQLSGFGGMCYHCKQTRHKAHECPKKTGDGSNGNSKRKGKSQFQGKCDNCDQQGHEDVLTAGRKKGARTRGQNGGKERQQAK